MQEENETLKAKLDGATDQLDKLLQAGSEDDVRRDELARKSEQVRELEERLTQVKSKAQARISELKRAIEEKDAQLTSQLQHLQEERDALQSRNNTLQTESETIQTQVLSLKEQLQDRLAGVQQLQEQLREQQVTSEALQTSHADLELAASDKRALQTEVAELKVRVSELDARNKVLRVTCEEVTQEKDEAVATREAYALRLAEEKTEVERDCDVIRTQLSESNASLAEVQQQLADKTSAFDALTRQHDDVTAQLQQSQSDVTELRAALDTQRQQLTKDLDLALKEKETLVTAQARDNETQNDTEVLQKLIA